MLMSITTLPISPPSVAADETGRRSRSHRNARVSATVVSATDALPRPHRCENRSVTLAHGMVATSGFDALRIPQPEEELQERFETLQRKLVSQWDLIEGFTDEPYQIVVVPSLSGIDLPLDAAKRQAYEE